MREIKFRAWNKKHNIMVSWEQMKIDNTVTICFGSIDSIRELMQYTGLKDKNGKEIYESDYLGDWCVYWGTGKYILQNISTGDIMDCNETNTHGKEITGNRYETPREHPTMETDL